MHTKVMFSLLAIFFLLFAASLEAQERGRGGRGGRGFGQLRLSRTALVRIDAVQKELEVSDDQKAELDELRGGGRGGGGERGRRGGASPEQVQAEVDSLSKILLDHQMQRLNEIFVQVQGAAALQDPVVASKLEISEEQKEQMQEIQTNLRSEMRELFQSEDREQAMEKFAEMQEESNKEIMAVLSDKQSQDFEKMKGEKFELPENALQRGGRGRDRGRDDGDGR